MHVQSVTTGLMILLITLSASVAKTSTASASASESAEMERQQVASNTVVPRLRNTRGAASNDRSQQGLHEFENERGIPTLTNIPNKYRNRNNFQETNVQLRRVTVPQQYQNYTRAQYSNQDVEEIVKRYATQYGLSENLIHAVIKMESNGNVNAVSHAGASGLMQLMPGTASDMGVTDIFDPAQNIAGGAQYLARMLDIFDGDLRLALAGYNAGPEAVRRHGGIPPYRETQNYVERVTTYFAALEGGNPSVTRPTIRQLRENAAAQASLRDSSERYMVHFKSGLTQPADSVEDREPYYYIEYGRRVYPVRKDLVNKIVEPSPS